MVPIETFDSQSTLGHDTLSAELSGFSAAAALERLDPPPDLRYGRRFSIRIFTS
jgi:hypothetical protein